MVAVIDSWLRGDGLTILRLYGYRTVSKSDLVEGLGVSGYGTSCTLLQFYGSLYSGIDPSGYEFTDTKCPKTENYRCTTSSVPGTV